MDSFKLLGDMVGKQREDLLKQVAPVANYPYDGVIHDNRYIYNILEAKDFICPRCQSTRCIACPCSTQKKKFLSCREDRCLAENSHASKPSTLRAKGIGVQEPRYKLKDFGIDTEYQSCSFDLCDQHEEIKYYLKLFACSPVGMVVLAGSPGTGKTYSGICTIERYIATGGRSPYFIRYPDLYQRWLKLTQEGGQPLGLLETLQTQGLLLIDDFGSRKPSEAFGDFIFLLIDKRKSSRYGTIITTNLSSKEIEVNFGSALLSRLVSGKCFKFVGKDRRISKF